MNIVILNFSHIYLLYTTQPNPWMDPTHVQACSAVYSNE